MLAEPLLFLAGRINAEGENPNMRLRKDDVTRCTLRSSGERALPLLLGTSLYFLACLACRMISDVRTVGHLVITCFSQTLDNSPIELRRYFNYSPHPARPEEIP